MHEYNKQKETEISVTEAWLEQLKQEYEPYRAQEDLKLLIGLFPKLGENLQIAQLCNGVGVAIDAIKQLFTGKLCSSEHDQSFGVQKLFYKYSKNRIARISSVFLLMGKISSTDSG